MAIGVENFVKAYEVDGVEPRLGALHRVKVRSHWNRREFVVIESLDGARVTVLAADLRAAIDNAQNTGSC